MPSYDSESTVTEDVGLFEAAAHAHPLNLAPVELTSIVLAPDGSNQDASARRLATAVASTTGAAIHERSSATTAAEIVRACTEHRAQLLIVPAPFGRDLDTLRDESLGSVVDILLLEAPCPVLCVRQLLDESATTAVLRDLLLPLLSHDESAAVRAACWAFRLLPRGGQLEVVGVVDRDLVNEALPLVARLADPAALRPEALTRALTEEMGSLVSAVQRRGSETGVGVHVETVVGRFVATVLDRANARPRLLVVAAPREHPSPAFHRAADLILGAKGPVLFV